MECRFTQLTFSGEMQLDGFTLVSERSQQSPPQCDFREGDT